MRWIVGGCLLALPPLAGCGKNCGFTYVAGGTMTVSIGDRSWTADNVSAEELETWLEPPPGFVPERPEGGWLERAPAADAPHHLVGYFSWEPDGDGLCGEDELNEIEVDLTFRRDLLEDATIEVREVDGAFVTQNVSGGRGLTIDQFAPESGTWTYEEPTWGQDTICTIPEGPIVVEWDFDPEQELDRTESCN